MHFPAESRFETQKLFLYLRGFAGFVSQIFCRTFACDGVVPCGCFVGKNALEGGDGAAWRAVVPPFCAEKIAGRARLRIGPEENRVKIGGGQTGEQTFLKIFGVVVDLRIRGEESAGVAELLHAGTERISGGRQQMKNFARMLSENQMFEFNFRSVGKFGGMNFAVGTSFPEFADGRVCPEINVKFFRLLQESGDDGFPAVAEAHQVVGETVIDPCVV